MIEVACWKIVWAILGAMLAALSFGDAYRAEGSYLTLIVMNFVIAIAMLMTPAIVRSLTSNGFQSMTSSIGGVGVAAFAAGPAKLVAKSRAKQNALNASRNYMNYKARNQGDK